MPKVGAAGVEEEEGEAVAASWCLEIGLTFKLILRVN